MTARTGPRITPLMQAQQIAIQQGNTAMALRLSQRVQRLIDRGGTDDLNDALAARDELHQLTALVATELGRIRTELTYHLGDGSRAPVTQRIDRVAG